MLIVVRSQNDWQLISYWIHRAVTGNYFDQFIVLIIFFKKILIGFASGISVFCFCSPL